MKRLLQKSVNLLPYRCRSWIKHIPGLKQLQRKLIESHLDGSSFNHAIKGGPADGLVYPIVLPDDKGIWLGNYEQSFSEILATSVVSGDVCYDIGGFRGFFSGIMACRGASQVYVFEPLPANVEQIRAMVALNPSMDISIHQIALADTVGETSFKVMPEASMGKLNESSFQPGKSSDTSIEVKLETIDSMLEEGKIRPAQLVKIDVEGSEALVLKGASRLLSEHRPRLFVEAHSHELAKECVDLLSSHGYSLRVIETGSPPDFETEPDVCHIEAIAR